MRRKFYRGRLATIVWDPAADKPLAVFEGGQFITMSDKVAEKLLDLGYKEVGLKDLKPPILPEEPIQDVGNIKIMSGGMSEKVELANLEAKQEQGFTGTDTDSQKPKAKTKGGGKKSITRRPK